MIYCQVAHDRREMHPDHANFRYVCDCGEYVGKEQLDRALSEQVPHGLKGLVHTDCVVTDGAVTKQLGFRSHVLVEYPR